MSAVAMISGGSPQLPARWRCATALAMSMAGLGLIDTILARGELGSTTWRTRRGWTRRHGSVQLDHGRRIGAPEHVVESDDPGSVRRVVIVLGASSRSASSASDRIVGFGRKAQRPGRGKGRPEEGVRSCQTSPLGLVCVET
jgi:hypothetical protein